MCNAEIEVTLIIVIITDWNLYFNVKFEGEVIKMDNLINIETKDGQLVVSSREVAKNFEKLHKDVLEAIERLIEGVAEKSADPQNDALLFIPSEYQHEQNKQWYKEYLLTRDGFSLLVMGFTGAKALEWKLKYIQAFNAMEKRLNDDEELSPLLKVLINLERNQNKVQRELTEVSQRLDNMGDVIRLNRDNWRKHSKTLIVKIANKWGGFEYIPEVIKQIYQELEERMGVNLASRKANRQRRMAIEGATKSSREKISMVDVIADDKKLIEGYMAIIKEMAVKYGVADEEVDNLQQVLY